MVKLKNPVRDHFFVLFLAGILILNACATKEKTVQIPVQTSVPDGPLKELYQQIAPKTQSFTIHTNVDTTLHCKNGSLVSIPRNSLVDASGEVVKDAKIDIIEALSPADYIKAHLQTVSDGKLLVSSGMIYIDAKTATGEQLKIKDDASIHIEMPTDANNSKNQLFTGSYTADKKINWTPVAAGVDSGMIPLPLSEFDYKYYTKLKIKLTREDKSTPTNEFYMQTEIPIDSIILNDKKYENTYIATPEFEMRFNWLSGYFQLSPFGGIVSRWGIYGDDYWDYERQIKEYKEGDIIIIKHQILDVYLKNTDKPLWMADSLVEITWRKIFQKDSISWFKKNHDSIHDWRLGEYLYLKSQHPTTVRKFKYSEIDLSKKDAYDQMIGKGATPAIAFDQLNLYQAQQNIIKIRKQQKDITKARDTAQTIINKAFTTGLNIKQLGWVNLDQFYHDPKCKEVKLLVQIDPKDSMPFADISMIIPGRNIAINGNQIATQPGQYKFTGEEAMYRNLPVGEKAFIIGLFVKNKQPYFAIQAIEIKDQTVNLSLKQSTAKDIEDGITKNMGMGGM